MGQGEIGAIFAPPLVGSAVLFFLFLYLWRIYRERYLGIWAAAWGLWFLRRLWSAIALTTGFDNPPVLLRLTALTYSTLALVGALEYAGRKISKGWILAGLGAVALNVVFPRENPVSGGPAMVYIAVLGAIWFWAGRTFLIVNPELGKERWIPAASLMLMGIHTWSIPWVGLVGWFAPWRAAVTMAIQIGVSIGVLVLFDRRSRLELTKTYGALEAALTKALAGHIPVCASCKNVRVEDDSSGERWQDLEAYISSETMADITHGICPSCMTRLYPEFAAPE